jgi:hypothetical protein
MTITVRLEPELERQLSSAARQEGLTRSELTRICLKDFLERRKTRKSAWELGKDLFGRFGSGRGDLSRGKRAVLREKIHAKKGRG